jgi:hypothetical protein
MLEVASGALKLVLGTDFLPSSTFYCSSLRGFLFSKLFVLEKYNREISLNIPKHGNP